MQELKAKTKKLFGKTKDSANKTFGKTKDKAKTALKTAKVKAKDLRHNSVLNDILAKGEFVVNRDYRMVLSMTAYLLLLALFVLSMGELLFALVTHFVVKKYWHLLTEFAVTKYMVLSFVALFVFDIFFLWALTSYQEVEERHDIPGIKRRHICLKISYYLSFALLTIMAVLYHQTSDQFDGLSHQLSTRVVGLISGYNSSKQNKETMDRLQWSYQCCGGSDHKEWSKYSFNGKDMVPFSCCKRSCCQRSKCQFANTSSNIDTINTNGCEREIKNGFVGLRIGVQWYRLTEFAIVFCFALLIDVIERSLHSQYDIGTPIPVSRFPLLYFLFAVISLLILYFFYFKSFEWIPT